MEFAKRCLSRSFKSCRLGCGGTFKESIHQFGFGEMSFLDLGMAAMSSRGSSWHLLQPETWLAVSESVSQTVGLTLSVSTCHMCPLVFIFHFLFLSGNQAPTGILAYISFKLLREKRPQHSKHLSFFAVLDVSSFPLLHWYFLYMQALPIFKRKALIRNPQKSTGGPPFVKMKIL